jgi:hypothetical protein
LEALEQEIKSIVAWNSTYTIFYLVDAAVAPDLLVLGNNPVAEARVQSVGDQMGWSYDNISVRAIPILAFVVGIIPVRMGGRGRSKPPPGALVHPDSNELLLVLIALTPTEIVDCDCTCGGHLAGSHLI